MGPYLIIAKKEILKNLNSKSGKRFLSLLYNSIFYEIGTLKYVGSAGVLVYSSTAVAQHKHKLLHMHPDC